MKLWQSRYNPQCKLSQQGLLDISEEITQAYAPHDKQHQPELVLMPVDPINLYAYWNLKGSATDNIIEHVDKQLALRIYSLPELSADSGAMKLSFDIKVQGFRNQQQVHLPVAASAYSAVIGEINADDSFSPLVTSETIHVPRETPKPKDEPVIEESVQRGEVQAHVLVPVHLPQESFAAEDSDNNSENTIPVEQARQNDSVAEGDMIDSWRETKIIKNYNDYGYDLKVYIQESDLGSNPVAPLSRLSKQDSNIAIHPKQNKTHSKNISALGRLS